MRQRDESTSRFGFATGLVVLSFLAFHNGAAAQVRANTATSASSGTDIGAVSNNARNSNRKAATRRLGPAWQKGMDGAQNPRKLKNGMKMQERRQRHQYQQAMTQGKEQQQQQYEKEMLQKLGSQRPEIKQKRSDIKRVRQETGANN